jgi:serine/threonine protein phosphatase PrpC
MVAPHLPAPPHFTIFTEKRKGAGEDAQPFIAVDGNGAAIAVFDGMGGAGGQRYKGADGNDYTGAYLASRQVLQTWSKAIYAFGYDSAFAPDFPELLALRFARDLQKRLERLGAPPSRFRGSMIRNLPTTMAAGVVRATPDQKIEAAILWAGDSRVYAVTPHGAHQLSRDDIGTGDDALQNMYDDSPMSNSISADRPFVVHRYILTLDTPLIFFAATDGIFGYLGSPMHTEWLLLKSLLEAVHMEDWKLRFEKAVLEVTGDDATMALVVLGCDGFEELQDLFRIRADSLFTVIINPLEQTSEDSKRSVLEQLWKRYKPGYEWYMSTEEAADASR